MAAAGQLNEPLAFENVSSLTVDEEQRRVAEVVHGLSDASNIARHACVNKHTAWIRPPTQDRNIADDAQQMLPRCKKAVSVSQGRHLWLSRCGQLQPP